MNKNLHLIICSIALVPIALGYGLAPNLPDHLSTLLLDFKPATTDQNHIFRAIMGLYLAMVVLWVMGILKPDYWKAATIGAIFFMGGLCFGRLSSILVDGLPSIVFILAATGEFAMALWGILNLKKYTPASN